jgi:AcrR family transcriptional regulator
VATKVASKRRGRPPNGSDSVSTRLRLLEAAFAACLDHGFDGVVLSDVAARAGVTANAVYNHFDSKNSLMVATARHALDELALPPSIGRQNAEDRARAITHRLMAQSAAPTRRIIAELNVAGRRNPEVARLMAEWNKETVSRWLTLIGRTNAARAQVKAFYLVLLGACMLDAVDDIKAPTRAVARLLEDSAARIFE